MSNITDLHKSTVCRITAILDKNVASPEAIAATAKECGIVYYNMLSGRSTILHERTGFWTLLSTKAVLESTPAEVVCFLSPIDIEEDIIVAFTERFRLDIGGRGSIYSEDVTMGGEHEFHAGGSIGAVSTRPKLLTELQGICCIVQRGQGDVVARVALETGISVPVATFGEGTGVRDKLGLLRITIPAEKEIVNVLTSAYDADVLMDMMIDAAQLDQPGRGFIFSYPIRKGFVNAKVSIGNNTSAASMEQLIAAIDELKGGVQWRSRSVNAGNGASNRSSRKFLNNLVELLIHCDEGRGSDLVKAAMVAGAAGATIARERHACVADTANSSISPARESCSMIISESQIAAISEAVEKAGLFDEHTHGRILLRQVPKACTYLGKSK
jgi:hypothetical protein